ncbi:probable voltage-dependent N-type calcium channel subunit alpha-1B isoform X2 [Hydra vulgaris]|uniref:probable voltage-dependent N-type calcium channel subunit alpha-1B isoform X2 n=1 Tax=Hydra vulgaris TaxID=6087 RepID=UPI001F5F7FF6|nr:probable voltage-dependent N-type calcium channel subunit alpha-1B isoform X2 [Hydra vulgaris]
MADVIDKFDNNKLDQNVNNQRLDFKRHGLSISEDKQDMYFTKSLYIFSPTNPLRRLCVAISTSKLFELFIILSIATNCVVMGLNTSLPNNDMSNLNYKLMIFDYVFVAVFSFEAILKILSQGFIMDLNSYMRNKWNIFDLSVLIASIVVLFQTSNYLSWIKVIKAARVFRPLKFVAGIPSLNIVMGSILKSLSSLLHIGIFIGFVIIIYAVIGQLFLQDGFHQACFYIGNNTYIDDSPCGISVSLGYQCPKGTTCRKYWIGPNSGLPNFDNILFSSITIFTCITCEGWTDVMYSTYRMVDYNGYFIWIYFFSLIVIGSHFMLNLVCGVLSGQFSKESELIAYRTEFQRKRVMAVKTKVSTKYSFNKNSTHESFATKKINEPKKEKKIEVNTLKIAIFRAKLKKIMTSSFMEWSIIVLVFLNSVSGAIQYSGQPDLMTSIEDMSDHVFIAFYFLETSLKVFAFGPVLYFKSNTNRFDFVVLIASLLDWVIKSYYKINIGVSVFRQLKLLRFFKFTRHWKSLKFLVASILSSLSSILSLLLLLFIFTLIFALLGMQFFCGELNTKKIRTNFDDFVNAVLTVFQIITGEDWNIVMNNAILTMTGKSASFNGFLISLYFVAVTCIGRYVLLNIFLAIAVANISLTDNEKKEIANEESGSIKLLKNINENLALPEIVKDHYSEEGIQSDIEVQSENLNGEFDVCLTVPAKPGENILENLKNPARMLPQPFRAPILKQKTLFIFSPSNPLRKILHRLVTSSYFDMIISGLIIIYSILLACEDVKDADAKINQVLKYADYIFLGIFLLEAVIKIINYGFALHPGSYCRDIWNCIDLLVVACGLALVVLDYLGMKFVLVRVFQIIRVLRPLKLINKLPKLKAVFMCMFYSLKNVFLVIILSIHILLIYSIMGVQIFSGTFYYCTDKSIDKKDDCRGNYVQFESSYNQPKELKREWLLYPFNFDNILNAMLTLFTSSTGDAWYLHMQRGIDSTDIDSGPIENNRTWVAIYFISFVVVFSFFFMNVFIGMIILTFHEQGAAVSRKNLNQNTINSLVFAMNAKPMKRFMPEDVKSFQYAAWVFTESNAWEITTTCLIILNTIALVIEFEGEPDIYSAKMKDINTTFSFFFLTEFLIKFFALGFNYFKDLWNGFDLIIVLGGLIDFAIKLKLSNPDAVFDTSIFRFLRALRLVKLLRRSRSLRILLWIFIKSFQALPYVGMLILLLFFVYAIIGMQTFYGISIASKDSYINENNHFRSFFSSIQVLFRISTGENWPDIMLACAEKAPCDKAIKSTDGDDICGSYFSYIYFTSFIFFSSFLLLNLFVAVIMDNFSFLTADSSILGPHHLDEFISVWSNFDPRASGRIRYTEVCELLRQMLPPIGLGTNCSKTLAYKRLVKMNMILYKDETIEFTGMFFALVRTGLSFYTENANLKSNDQECRKTLKEVFPSISKRTLDLVIPRTPRNSAHMTIAKIFSAKLILENYKAICKKKSIMRKKRYNINQSE